MMFSIFRQTLPETDREGRRAAERAASLSLVREVFGEEAELLHHPDGAPWIPQAPDGTVYSLSHSARECVLATASGVMAIGIDIETPRPQLMRVCHKFLSENERRFIPADDITLLLKAWTAKEAVYKAARTPGLPLADIEIVPGFTHAHALGRTYTLHYPQPGTCVAVLIFS